MRARKASWRGAFVASLVHCPSLPVLTMPCRSFVSRQEDVPLPVLVTAYKDKSFEFVRSLISRLAPFALAQRAAVACRS